MEKGSFSVEWLAQSSGGGAREMLPGTARPREAAERSSPGHDAGAVGSAAHEAGAVGSAAHEAGAVGSAAHEAGAVGSAAGRSRTKFSAAQLQELERSFGEQRYIGAGEKRRLATVLNLSQSQIKTWFQNRRMKFKRQTQDARIEALFSGLFLPYHRYPDMATSSYPHGMDINVSATSAVCLHPAMPNPALLPAVPAQSLQPVLPSPALQLPPGPELSCYSSVLPAVTLTTEHKRLMFQPDFPSC